MSLVEDVDTHFRFGENWSEYAKTVSEPQIAAAQVELARILGTDDLSGKTFLDIGSGSGLHSLAALRLGAARVLAVDFDPDSTRTTTALLTQHWAESNWTAENRSVFDLNRAKDGEFDVVYSWGVLHHTGDMYGAIERAGALVKPGGTLVLALYARTMLCGFWRIEKRLYSRAPKVVQKLCQLVYIGWYRLIQTLTHARRGELFSYKQTKAEYFRSRGMRFSIDVHDWLGGYPYESISPRQMHATMDRLGFSVADTVLQPGGRHGLLGSGCDEYRLQRR